MLAAAVSLCFGCHGGGGGGVKNGVEQCMSLLIARSKSLMLIAMRVLGTRCESMDCEQVRRSKAALLWASSLLLAGPHEDVARWRGHVI